MTKKEYIIKLLTFLESSWDVAWDLRKLVEQDLLWEDTLNVMLKVFKEWIKKINNEKNKKILEESIEKIEKIKQLEEQEKQEDLLDLEKMIGDIQ